MLIRNFLGHICEAESPISTNKHELVICSSLPIVDAVTIRIKITNTKNSGKATAPPEFCW